MILWLLALAAGALAAWLGYGRLPQLLPADRRPPARGLAAALLALARGAAVTLLAAFVLRAPAGTEAPPASLVAVDVSESWARDGRDSAAARWARVRAIGDATDSVLLLGDSARLVAGRELAAMDAPTDAHSQVDAAVDRALAAGRALRLVTDGAIEDRAALRSLPAGSRIDVDAASAVPDLAVADVQLPDALGEADSLVAEVQLVAGAAGAPSRALVVRLGDGGAARRVLPTFAPWETRRERVVFAPRTEGGDLPVRVWLEAPTADEARALPAARGEANDAGTPATGPDRVARNDTLVARTTVRTTPPVVFLSTAPDLDVREALRVLRGADRVATAAGASSPAGDRGVTAYLRIARGQWRREGTLARVEEARVLAEAQAAGLLVVHGDTSGLLRAGGRQSRVLWEPAPPPPPPRAGEPSPPDEWFVVAPSVTPLGAALEALPVESLAPLALGPVTAPAGVAGAAATWPRAGATIVLRAQRRRVGAEIPLVALDESGAGRRVWIRGSGVASWSLRGGRGADAFLALFGALFDWARDGASSEDAPTLATTVVRRGEPLRWRRGRDSLVVLRRERDGAPADSVTLRFAGNARDATTPALAEGRWTLRAADRDWTVVVNPSAEWVPVPPIDVAVDSTQATVAAGTPRPLTRATWPIVLALLLLCGEWLGRRAAGLR